MEITLETLSEARAALKRECERWDNYSGNNPNKGAAERRYLVSLIQDMERDLKDRGELPRTDEENLQIALDEAFPKALSREIVTYLGKTFRRRFRPAEMSRSRKTVMRWHRWWEPMPSNGEG